MNSKPFTLNKADLKKIGTGAVIVTIGALLTYGTEAIGTIDLGETWTPVVTAAWSIFVNVVRKLIAGKENN